jgi:hypothetical protein
MDDVLMSVYRNMAIRFRCSTEDILEDPELRNVFLTEVRQSLGYDLPERQLLHRLQYLRKQRRLPRIRDIVSAG